jgi:hypothetical protein
MSNMTPEEVWEAIAASVIKPFKTTKEMHVGQRVICVYHGAIPKSPHVGRFSGFICVKWDDGCPTFTSESGVSPTASRPSPRSLSPVAFRPQVKAPRPQVTVTRASVYNSPIPA